MVGVGVGDDGQTLFFLLWNMDTLRRNTHSISYSYIRKHRYKISYRRITKLMQKNKCACMSIYIYIYISYLLSLDVAHGQEYGAPTENRTHKKWSANPSCEQLNYVRWSNIYQYVFTQTYIYIYIYIAVTHTHTHTHTHIYNRIRRCPWCNGYRRRKWTWRHFKSWTKLFAFHIALISLGKVWIQLFSL